MAQLRHPGIVGVIEEEGEDGGYRFFVMEYVGGGDRREAVLAERLTVEQRLWILLGVGDALDHAHREGVIHRELHDMHGNVWEWVDDEFEHYAPEPQTDPVTPSASRSSAVVRGGSYRNSSRFVRSACRVQGRA